jgi:hypothetical protein
VPKTPYDEGNRHTKARSVSENQQSATPWPPKRSRPKSKPLSRLRRGIKSVPRKTRFVVEYVPLASILPNPINPRKHSRQQIDALAHSIESFGFNAPILIDGGNRIVAGHARLERAVFGLNRGGDSRIGQILIQPVGWAEASRNAEAVFARLA